MRLLRKVDYILNIIRMKNLEDAISISFLTPFDKTKRATLWYIACRKRYSDPLEYAFYKVYGLWGMDGISESEKKEFKLI